MESPFYEGLLAHGEDGWSLLLTVTYLDYAWTGKIIHLKSLTEEGARREAMTKVRLLARLIWKKGIFDNVSAMIKD